VLPRGIEPRTSSLPMNGLQSRKLFVFFDNRS
jgi:hypothetical protein